MLPLTGLFHSSLLFAARLEPPRLEPCLQLLLLGGHWTNTLAYYDAELIRFVKSFIVWAGNISDEEKKVIILKPTVNFINILQ